MNKYTDLNQSKKLAEVWKDAETGLIHFEHYDYGWVTGEVTTKSEKDYWDDVRFCGEDCGDYKKVDCFPAFSISDILERLPAEVEGLGFAYLLTITKSVNNYMVRYQGLTRSLQNKYFSNESLLTALVDLTLWLHEQKYIGEGQNG